jgi:hypothetical protein
MLRVMRRVLAILFACTAATLPACGSMGGGGMHYFADPVESSRSV